MYFRHRYAQFQGSVMLIETEMEHCEPPSYYRKRFILKF